MGAIVTTQANTSVAKLLYIWTPIAVYSAINNIKDLFIL